MAVITPDMIRRVALNTWLPGEERYDRPVPDVDMDEALLETEPVPEPQKMSPKERSALREAEILIPSNIQQRLRRVFTPRGLDFFLFYIEMKKIELGVIPFPEDLIAEFTKTLYRINQIISPVDHRSISPPIINMLALAKPDLVSLFNRMANNPDRSVLWRQFNEIYVPLIIEVAKDKGVFLRALPRGVAKWATFRNMSDKQEATEKLRDEDPDSYAAIIRADTTYQERRQKVVSDITNAGLELKRTKLRGRYLVEIGVDKVTGEERVYGLDGSVLPVQEYIEKKEEQEKARSRAAKMPVRTQVPLRNLKAVSDEDLVALEGPTEWMSISDDIAKSGRLTRIFPTKVKYQTDKDEKGVPTSMGVRVVTNGRYKGCQLDDLINSEGRLIEGTAYTYNPRAREHSVPVRIDPTQREPYVTVADTLVRKEGQLKKVKQLYISISGESEFAELRNVMKALAINAQADKGYVGTRPLGTSISTVRWAQYGNLEHKTQELLEIAKEKSDAGTIRSAQGMLTFLRSHAAKDSKNWSQTDTTDFERRKRVLAEAFKEYEIKGSRQMGFYFSPKDFGIIRDAMQGMSVSTEALAMLRQYYQDLAYAEEATARKNLTGYTMPYLEGFKKIPIKDKDKNPVLDAQGNPKYIELLVKQQQAVAWLDASGNQGVCALDTGVGKCVREDTLISTNKGIRPIRDLNPGLTEADTVSPITGWSVQLDGQALPVKNFYFGGLKPTIRVQTRRGYEIEGSRVHPLLVRTPDGQEVWIQTPELEPGDFLCVERKDASFALEEPALSVPLADDFQQRSRNPDVSFTNGQVVVFPVPDRMSPDLGRLLGYLVAEGWVNNDKVFTISQCPEKNPEVRADIEKLLREILGWQAPPEKDIYINSVFLREYLSRLGVKNGLSATKTVPETVLRSTKETVQQFLRGLIDAECHIDAHIEYSTASEQLAREIQVLLLGFGILSSRTPKRVRGYDHTYWRLTLCGQDARRYTQQIGFVSHRKQIAAEALPAKVNANLDVVPYLAPVVGQLYDTFLEKAGFNTTSLRQYLGDASLDNTVRHIRFGRRNATYEFLRRLLAVSADFGCQDHPAFKALESVLDRHFFYDPIKKLAESEAVVMDIEVDDPSHCFVGNGLVNHNTLTAIAVMQKLTRDGMLSEDASYTNNRGREIKTNGRFLYVGPKDLIGNVVSEIKFFLSEEPSKDLRGRVDDISFQEFARAMETKQVPTSLAKSNPYWKARIDEARKKPSARLAQEDAPAPMVPQEPAPAALAAPTPFMPASGVPKKKEPSPAIWAPQQYVAIFFDEAHKLSHPDTKVSKAAQSLWHPRKVLLTASPIEKNPMEAYVLAAIATNKPLRGKAGKDNALEMRRFKKRFCETLGGRIMGVQQDVEVKRELHTWVKRNIFFADKKDIEEFTLPELRQKPTVVEMPEDVEMAYRDVTSQFAKVMKGLVMKFRDRGKVPGLDRVEVDPTTGEVIKRVPSVNEAKLPEIEQVFGKTFQPLVRLMDLLSNDPAQGFMELANVVEHGGFTDAKGVLKKVPDGFQAILNVWKKRYSPEALRARAVTLPNPKLQTASERIMEKISNTEGKSRSIIFAEDAKLCMAAGKHFAKTIPGVHCVALRESIHLFDADGEITEIKLEVNPSVLEQITKSPENQERFIQETGGVGIHTFPFNARVTRRYPQLPRHDKFNPHSTKGEWKTFCFKELIGPRQDIKTISLEAQVYQYGQNFQFADTVVHLDRNKWNSESMKQRTARAWRQKQQNPVDEIIIDATYSTKDKAADPRFGDFDKTLDEIRAYFQVLEGELFDRIIKDAQSTQLGAEWAEMQKKRAQDIRIDKNTFELIMSPYVERTRTQ